MLLKLDVTKLTPDQLPATGYARARRLLQHVPFAKSTLWAWMDAQGTTTPEAANDAGGA